MFSQFRCVVRLSPQPEADSRLLRRSTSGRRSTRPGCGTSS